MAFFLSIVAPVDLIGILSIGQTLAQGTMTGLVSELGAARVDGI